MGVNENRHATEVRRRLLNPPNAVPDSGIDLKRKRLPKPLQEPQEPPQQPEPQEIPPSSSNVLQFVPRNLTIMRLIEMVAQHTGFPVADLLGPSRKAALTFARHTAIWLCIKHFPRKSLPQIGLVFCKDHTSIIHARDRMRRYSDSNSPEGIRLRQTIQSVEGDIYDHSGPSVPDLSQSPVAVGQQESIQEQRVPSLDQGSASLLDAAEV